MSTSRSPEEGRRLGVYAYDAVKEWLLDGRWGAGEAIPVETVKKELGVSKQPVMEALRRLAADGLAEIIPQVGTRVPLFSADDISDFFVLFASVESEAAVIACRRGTTHQIAMLDAANQTLAEALAMDDKAERVSHYLRWNRVFHSSIVDMTRSAVVGRTSRRMWDMSDLMITTAGSRNDLSTDIADRHAEHDQLIDAFRRRDEDTVRTVMRHHVLRNVPMLVT